MTTYYALKSLDQDPKLAQALGNMVVAWAYAEEQLIGVLARVTGMTVNMAQAGYYRIPTFEARVKTIRAFLGEWKPDKYDGLAIDKAVDKLSHLASARNHWVHGMWLQSVGVPPKIIIIDPRSDPTSAHRSKPVKAADVSNHVDAVLKRAKDIDDLVDWDSLPI